MKTYKHIYRDLRAGLLLTVFSLVLANNTLYLHVHTLPDGSTVKHAHPYKKNKELPGKQHQHSSVELVTFGQSNNYVACDTLTDIVVFREFCFVIQEFITTSYDSGTSHSFGQRAPPFFVI